LFVPGSGGHAHWFSHLAPLFADQFNVVAMDVGGCGDSGRRESYAQELVAAEIMAVAIDSGMLQGELRPTLVGHSIGGQFAVRTAQTHGQQLFGVIAVDSLRYASLAKDSAIKALDGPRPPPRPSRVYADFDEAVARFRLTPAPQIPIKSTFVLDHIARHSLRRVEGGWIWKHDSALASVVTLGMELKDCLTSLRCHAAAVYGEHTHIADETLLEIMEAITDGEVPVLRIPGATHYAMIDSPIAFVAAIKGLVLAWLAADRRSRRRT
jgi:pimeloyl-ACP methyl ester carboxylesterase